MRVKREITSGMFSFRNLATAFALLQALAATTAYAQLTVTVNGTGASIVGGIVNPGSASNNVVFISGASSADNLTTAYGGYDREDINVPSIANNNSLTIESSYTKGWMRGAYAAQGQKANETHLESLNNTLVVKNTVMGTGSYFVGGDAIHMISAATDVVTNGNSVTLIGCTNDGGSKPNVMGGYAHGTKTKAEANNNTV
ncbi:MAG: hypothetical protein LBR50_07890, partial [Tannerella sp.]|nr:hypothetical protein [Tannerella sp.]